MPTHICVRDRNTSTSALVEHVCNTGHPADWSQTHVLERYCHTSKWSLLESTYVCTAFWTISFVCNPPTLHPTPTPPSTKPFHASIFSHTWMLLILYSMVCSLFHLNSCIIVHNMPPISYHHLSQYLHKTQHLHTVFHTSPKDNSQLAGKMFSTAIL